MGKKSINHQPLTINHRSGFTLIEILVAATIVGLLSTIGMTGFQAVTRNGRDALRKSDLEQIRSALEIYKSENNAYPDDENCGVDSGVDMSQYINTYPSDPRSTNYRYCYVRSDELHYNICAHLENGASTDLNAGGSCGADNNCGADDPSTQVCNYKVTNP
jgi:general secretion pathway protein G